MKLSVSAYRAQASAHKKILNNSYQMMLNYGATCTTQTPAAILPHVKVEEVEGSSSHHHGMVDSTGVGPGPGQTAGDDATASGAAGSSASESSPRQSGVQSLVTSREEDGEEDGHGGENASGGGSIASSDKSPGQRHPPLGYQSRSKSVGEQKWRNLRAVMALYTRLRKIKRTKSNQRWMKLRTTVQLSGAITTIQKKPPLKREDSFLKRFSTRQIPETQETMDTGDDGDGGPSSQSSASTRRRRRRRQRLPRTVVNPDENFYFYWLFVLSVCVLYNLWTLIVRQSFPELQEAATIMWFTCDGFSDTVFLLDIAVQLRTGYLEQGLMVYDSKKLAGHYLHSKAFLMDLGALLPLDFLQFYCGVQPILRFPRFIKVYRVYDYYYMVESRTVYPNLWRVVNLVHILLILAHWFGCFYYLLSEAEGFIEGWAYPYHKSGYQELTRKYLGSLYWSTLTLTTIGDLPTPETNAEYVFTIVSYLIGVFIFATIVGQVGNVITNRNANRLEFERLLDGAKTYMRHHKVPGGMKRRVLRWYDYSWSRGRIQGGGDINTALGLLPDKLKTELALHVNLSVLKKVTIFQECQPEFLHDLVLKMKAYIFTPGDLICRKGEVAREMFIIADGILEVISETGRVLTTMKAGDFFGEIGILNLDGLNKRTADVRSVGYSELFSLSREDVLAAMKDYPEAQEILQSLGRKRLMEARNVSRPKSSGHHDKGVSTSVPSAGTAGDGDTRAGKRIVEKLRSDVKGLKNALRKSRRGTRTKDESMELQPLNPSSLEIGRQSSGHSGKGVLRRMSRVRSDETYSREESMEETPAPQTVKIGEGLPMLQRLRLLKEKQDKEEKGKQLLKPTSPPPPPPPAAEPEVIGAGLPLIQRLLLLKQKEERERLAMQSAATAAADALASTVKTQKEVEAKKTKGSSSDESKHSSSSKEQSEDECVITRKPSLLNRLVASKHKDSSAGVPPQQKSDASSTSSAEPATSVTKPPLFREKLKLLSQKDNMPSSSSSSTGTVTSPPKSQAQTSAKCDGETPTSTLPAVLKKQHSWSLLKKASILSTQNSGESSKISTPRTVTPQSSVQAEPSVDLKRTALAEEEPVVPVHESEPTPSSSVKGVSLFKQKIAKLTGDVTEEKLNNAETQEIAQEDKKPEEDNKEEDKAKEPECEEGVAECPVAESSTSTIEASTSSPERKVEKPNLLHIQDTKFYMSIDDLSPEYSGLPFVKKLKILNERQKLAELELRVAHVLMRSSSLDSSNTASGGTEAVDYTLDPMNLTRSHSEASAMQYVRTQQLNRDAFIHASSQTGRPTEFPQAPTEAPQSLTSPESNETLERRNLKSILKKLSASSLFSGSSDEAKGSSSSVEQVSEPGPTVTSPTEQPPASIDMRKLMRAPTIEGYAARHSKLTKSVTFNRDTLQSPPAVAVTPTEVSEEVPSSPFALPDESETTAVLSTCSALPSAVTAALTDVVSTIETNISTTSVTDVASSPKKKPQVSFLMQHPQIPLSGNEKNFFRPSLLLPSHASLEEEYFNEVIVGIKQVIQGHLEDIQNKFQTQFESLEQEVKRRDEIISQLQKRIHELEHPDSVGDGEDLSEADDGSDQPFMRGDSVDTVLASPPPDLPDDGEAEQQYQPISSPCLRQRQAYRRSWEDHSEEETMELLDLPRSMSPQHVWSGEDSVAVHLESSESSPSSSSSSSESNNDEDDAFGADDLHNRDWEVQMLARELERREDMSRLEDEVRDLKAAVSASDLSLLTSSELDILEQVLVAKDRKVRAAARALSLDSDELSLHRPHHSPSLSRRRLLKQRSTNGGGSIENLLYKTSLLKNRLLSATARRHQLLNARSLDETPETSSQASKASVVEHRRNRSASSGSIPPFSLPSASSLMRGLGNLVRSSRHSTTSLESAGSVPTISRGVSPDSSQHTSDPPPPPPDL